jgi:hypothetical protein
MKINRWTVGAVLLLGSFAAYAAAGCPMGCC